MSLDQRRRRLLFAVVLAVAIAAAYLQPTGGDDEGYVNVTVFQARSLIADKPELVILDVRTVAEFAEGHIEGAVNIPVQELSVRLDELSRDDELLVYCRSGNRSAQAAEILVEAGFPAIYHMPGGITEWVDAGLPVVS